MVKDKGIKRDRRRVREERREQIDFGGRADKAVGCHCWDVERSRVRMRRGKSQTHAVEHI